MKILITLFFIFTAPILSAENINDFIAQYDVYKNDFPVAQSTRTLRSKNNVLNFSSETQTTGFAALFYSVKINETSQLELKDNNLHFVSYDFNESKNNKNKRYQLLIDKPSQKLFNTKTQQYYTNHKNLQDMLGFTVAIMYDLKNGRRDLNYNLADKDKINSYHLKFIKEEMITNGNKEIKTLKMEHYDTEKKQRFTLWCAPEYDFIPLKIRKIKNNDDEILLALTKLNQNQFNLMYNKSEID